jgi:hypothetical protein
VLAPISGISSLGFQGVNLSNCQRFAPVYRTAGGVRQREIANDRFAEAKHEGAAAAHIVNNLGV